MPAERQPGRPAPAVRQAPPPVAGPRLPVRIRVPERDELLAMGLATLAVGLVLGLAIGPGLGTAGRIFPVITPQVAQVPIDPLVDDSEDSTDILPVLAAPAGSDSGGGSSTAPAPAPTTLAAAPVAPAPVPEPVPVEPPPSPAPPPTPDPAPTPDPTPTEPEGQTLPISGTVLAASVNGKSFSIADSDGNLQTVFGDAPPGVGESISTSVLPLANGTFAESGGRSTLRTRKRATVKGMISYADPEIGVIVLSNRGTSLPLDGEEVFDDLVDTSLQSASADENLDLEGQWVRLELSILDREQESEQLKSARPRSVQAVDPAESDPVPEETADQPRPDFGLRAVSVELLDETAASIELTGKVLSIDEAEASFVMAADSLGLLEAQITIVVPEKFKLSSVVPGKVYSATVRRTSSGKLRLSGFSPAFSGRAADRTADIFGEQGY